MENNKSGDEKIYYVNGTVRNKNCKPVAGVIVRAYSNGVFCRDILGEGVTLQDGSFIISCILKNIKSTAIVICVYDDANMLLKESPVQYKLPSWLEIDIVLGGEGFTGFAEYANYPQ